MSKKQFYVTTPIYYPSGNLHIGHAYTTVLADVLARYKKLMGYDVFFLTGSDDHGQKIEEAANEKKMTPKAFVDQIVNNSFIPLFKALKISNDIFMRTTNDWHEDTIKKIFSHFLKKDFIYKGKYKGLYCVKCEAFYTESQLVDGKCPDHQIELKEIEQESYMFRMNKFEDFIKSALEEDNENLASKQVKTELLNNFIYPGLTDLSLTRTNFTWGIPINEDKKHVIYVWLDALFNYATAVGLRLDKNLDSFDKFWGKDSEIVHIIGKDITRFHCIYWPIFLKALDLRLPDKIITHGLLRDAKGIKMSKSLGNVVNPNELIDEFGVDAVRLYLAMKVPTKSDGNISNELVKECFNSQLANGYGNLVSRTIKMVESYNDGIVPKYEGPQTKFCKELTDGFEKYRKNYIESFDQYNIADASNSIFELVSSLNKYIDETMPWALSKDETKKNELNAVLHNLMSGIQLATTMLEPIIPGIIDAVSDQAELKQYNIYDKYELGLCSGIKVVKKDNLYQRIK